MGREIESHPDARSRTEMLKNMHRRVRQKLQQTEGQEDWPRHAEEDGSQEAKVS